MTTALDALRHIVDVNTPRLADQPAEPIAVVEPPADNRLSLALADLHRVQAEADSLRDELAGARAAYARLKSANNRMLDDLAGRHPVTVYCAGCGLPQPFTRAYDEARVAAAIKALGWREDLCEECGG